MYTAGMAAILILRSIVLLNFILPIYDAAVANADCPELINLTKKSLIVTKHNAFAMDADVDDRSNGTVVKLTCNDFVTLILNDTGTIRCIGGKWDPPQPHCIPRPPPPVPNNPHLDTIIGGLISGCIFVLILVSIPEMVKRGRAWRLSKLQEAAKLLEEENQKRFFKVWTCGRNTKQFIKANGLTSLMRAASRTFKKPSIARIVLEEDGTEVDTDDILDVCADLTLMALAEGELWWDRNINSDDGRLDDKRLTFDVCNQDRTKRKLILATDLRDLYRQGQLVFGYLPSRACSESDGTLIDQHVLFAFVESTIMLLEQGGTWSSPSSPSNPSSVYTLPSIDRSSVRNSVSDSMMFKVWSSDHMLKLVVFARNLADLHIKAAKSHGLPNPIEISELSSGDVITSDTHLTSLANEVLIIKSSKYASDNNYQYIEKGSESDFMSLTSQNEFPSGGRHDDYAKVQKNWSGKERPQNSTHISKEHVPSNSVPRNEQHRLGSSSRENGHVPNGFPQREIGHTSNDRLNSLNEGNRYDPLPSRATMFTFDKPSQNNFRNSFIDMTEQDPRSTHKNNFGYLRDMSDESNRKPSVHEMSQLKSNPVYTPQHHSHSRPMVITGGAKQTEYSDVLF
ncbi:uncharacterized protein LOC110462036 [Mizuhopecten yessoensis]|uniref:Sushi domain-containing protein n=1 Tax=Mizuhopecten yessoensis TaxID=6573 RepID=A0A210PZ63_MIZYE|nr:uncharacterized protein LOC110462036 [Mizuhopecten yessoensis]OWF41709.1 hypothetical protein KP79_PYT22854 [Mizuhopecten yessoensis]